ncbi:MAG: primosomal protein N' [Oligoflexia bacterium]|nr:primosomal protein N' [Oligoflexia bacterium]
MIDSEFVVVAVDAPLPQALTYRLPKDLATLVSLGSRVVVPLGKRKSHGVVIGESEDASLGAKIKSIGEISDEPALGDKTRKWLKWLAQYYIHPPGQVYSLAFSPGLEGRKRKSKKTSPTFLKEGAIESAPPPTPNADQKNAIETIRKSAQEEKFDVFLLYGVTGSGKTEVYLQSIDHVLKAGKQALVLVPEISLTPQLIKRFVGRYGDNVAVLHSHLTERERSDQWWSVVRGNKQILVGARSALFCPLENLGLIVVDEEHETSFKQDEQLKYNARDAAIMRAQISNCPVVLGSATPSLESWQNTLTKKYKLLELSTRVENRPLPEFNIVDMRKEKSERDPNLPSWLSKQLFSELLEVVAKKEQAALFLNRRGFAQFILCPSCGYSEHCPQCSVTFTVHGRGTKIICHYCGLEKPIPKHCSSCKEGCYVSVGLGTEKIVDELQTLFDKRGIPVRIARADRDEINSREKLEGLLEKIITHEIDIIVGTQMIAKGHDFPNLTLVGIVLADIGLNLPDFRSSERTFQLLTQVAGRAGRHQKAGRVILQTFVPDHPAIVHSTKHDFKSFAESELIFRKELNYPPFGKLASVRLQGLNLPKVEQAADITRARIDQLILSNPEYQSTDVMGPCESAIAKLRNNYRFQLLLKTQSAKVLNVFLQHLTNDIGWLPTGVKLTIDVDPLQLM